MNTLRQQHLSTLRRKAEAQIRAAQESIPAPPPDTMQAALHDLHVHQVELALQYEELRQTQEELQVVARTQYLDLYRKYAALYDHAPVGYCTLDASGRILDINRTAVRQLKVGRSEALRARLYQYVYEEDCDRCFLHLRAAFASGRRQTCELRLHKPDGTLFWAQLDSVIIQVHPEGAKTAASTGAKTAASTARCLTTVTDLTAHRQAHEALRKANERFQQFFATLLEYAYIIGTDGTILDVNEAALQALGYTRDEMIGQSADFLYAPESRPKVKQLWARWQQTGVIRDAELEIVTKYGERRTVLLNVHAVRDAEGGMLHSTSLHTDITARKQAEDALRERQTRLTLLNGIATGLVAEMSITQVIDYTLREIHGYFPDLRVAYVTVNPAGMLTILASYQPADIQSLAGITADLNAAPEFLAALRQGRRLRIDDVAQDARLRPLIDRMTATDTQSAVIAPLSHQNAVLGLLCFDAPAPRPWTEHEITTLTDVAAYLTIALKDAQLHAEQQRMQAELEAALHAKHLLLKEVLHRTKNNMGTIISLLHLLGMRHDENTQMVAIFHDLEHRINAMMLVQRTLYESDDFTRINLKDYLDELAHTIFDNLRTSPINLTVKIAPVILPPEQALSCGLLVNELLTNALKYAFPPGRDGSPDRQPDAVQVMLQPLDGETVELRISDNGVGLPEGLDLDTHNSLGFLLISGFIRHLDGTFQITAEQGTCWRIRFPGKLEGRPLSS